MKYISEIMIDEIRSRIDYVVDSNELSESDKITLYQKCLEIIATDQKGEFDNE